jgi:hypothetical protein
MGDVFQILKCKTQSNYHGRCPAKFENVINKNKTFYLIIVHCSADMLCVPSQKCWSWDVSEMTPYLNILKSQGN